MQVIKKHTRRTNGGRRSIRDSKTLNWTGIDLRNDPPLEYNVRRVKYPGLSVRTIFFVVFSSSCLVSLEKAL